MKRGIHPRKAFLLLMNLCFLAMLAPQASAVTTTVSNYFYTDETFLLHDKIAIVNVNSYEEVIIDYDNSFIVIRNNTCQRVVNDEFCVDSILYDISKDRKKAKLNVYDLSPEITLTRSLNKSSPLKGEGIKITVTIENSGNTSVKNLTYIDLFPPEIGLTRVTEGYARIQKVPMWRNETSSVQNMTRVFWQGEIRPFKTHTITYTLKPISYVDGRFTAKVIYFDGIEEVMITSTQAGIKTESFFEISKKFAPEGYTVDAGSDTVITGEVKADVQIGEKVLFITELKNKALKNETINVSYIDFYFNENLLYEGPISFRVYMNRSNANESYTPGVHRLTKVGKNTYRWSGFLNEDGLIFAMKLKGTREGTARAGVYAHLVQFKEKELPYYEPLYDETYTGYEEIEVKLTDPTIESNFESGKVFESGEQAYFTIYMQNPNEYANFTGMDVFIDTPWLKKNLSFRNLKKTNYVNFFDGFVTMPYVSAITAKTFTVNATYMTEYGDTYSVDLKRTINIKPHLPIEISHSLSPSMGTTPEKVIISNKESLVTLRLTNRGNTKIEHINITEVTQPALRKGENMTRVVNLEGGSALEALNYKIDPPDVSELKQYRITAYIDYVSSNETYHVMKDTIIEVNPKSLSMDISKATREDYFSTGTPFYLDYVIENAEEQLENITIIFPLTQYFDIVGSRSHMIMGLGKDERIPVAGIEKIRAKTNGSSVTLPRTLAVFHDKYGNEFTANTSKINLEIIYKPFQSPALIATRSIPAETVNQSEGFPVSITIGNIGAKKTRATISDFGRSWDMEIDAGKEKTFTYIGALEETGNVVAGPAVINYSFDGEDYYTGSNTNMLDVIGAVKEAEVGAPPVIVEEKPPEVVEEKKERPYLKYIALVVFVMVVCLIILSVIRMRPTEKRFEFSEK